MIWGGGKDVFLPNQIAKFTVGKLQIRGGKFQKFRRVRADFSLSFLTHPTLKMCQQCSTHGSYIIKFKF